MRGVDLGVWAERRVTSAQICPPCFLALSAKVSAKHHPLRLPFPASAACFWSYEVYRNDTIASR